MAPFVEPRFGAGLTEADVRRFQSILREECGLDVGLPEAWARAIELLSLAEMVLESHRLPVRDRDDPGRGSRILALDRFAAARN